MRELNLAGGEYIVDVGCGTGQFTRVMARAVGPEGRVVGIEWDQEQLAEAHRLSRVDGGSERVAFRQGNALNLPLRPEERGRFDLAHARFLLEHIPQPIRVVSEMVRAVRPGGRVVVADDDHENFRLWPEPAGFHAVWTAYIRSYDRAGNDPYIGRRLVALFHTAGLRSIRNTCVFFGGCAGNDTFEAVADNLIGVLQGARGTILSGGFLDEASFETAIEGLLQWKGHPSAALWYTVCWAEGTVPD